MKDQAEREAHHRVILAAGEAMERQILIEIDNIESELSAKLGTARTIAVAALAKHYKGDVEAMYNTMDWFFECMTEQLDTMLELADETKH